MEIYMEKSYDTIFIGVDDVAYRERYALIFGAQ